MNPGRVEEMIGQALDLHEVEPPAEGLVGCAFVDAGTDGESPLVGVYLSPHVDGSRFVRGRAEVHDHLEQIDVGGLPAHRSAVASGAADWLVGHPDMLIHIVSHGGTDPDQVAESIAETIVGRLPG